MADEHVDLLVAAARDDLRHGLDAPPPDFGRLARRARARRRTLSGVAVVAAVVVFAVAIPLAWRDDNGGSHVVAGPAADGSNADLLGPGESRKLAPSPLAGRSTMAAVWTGREMLIWGGDSPAGQFADGAA